jgi:hypothetical protein
MQLQAGMPAKAPPPLHPNPQVDVNALVSNMACIISTSQALMTNPMTPSNNTKGHNYTEDQVAMVMGLACVTRPDCVSFICTKFFSTIKILT